MWQDVMARAQRAAASKHRAQAALAEAETEKSASAYQSRLSKKVAERVETMLKHPVLPRVVDGVTRVSSYPGLQMHLTDDSDEEYQFLRRHYAVGMAQKEVYAEEAARQLAQTGTGRAATARAPRGPRRRPSWYDTK
jgi:hypothetical protein